jgi:hypothetical protein
MWSSSGSGKKPVQSPQEMVQVGMLHPRRIS